MGWNSWDAYGLTIGEADFRANATVLAGLKLFGWQYAVIDEGWYVNMYWTAAARPAPGTKLLLRIPGPSRAVVAAAGFETGPGDLSMVGGTPEESHFYLGTVHGSTMQIGIATDQSIPFGPRVCE